MRLFLDTASIEECRAAAKLGVISGVTTNPSLWAQAGGGNYREIILEIAGIVDGPRSARRLADVGHEGRDMVAEVVDIFDRYRFPTQVIAASLRPPRHVIEAARAGAH